MTNETEREMARLLQTLLDCYEDVDNGAEELFEDFAESAEEIRRVLIRHDHAAQEGGPR